MPEGDDASRRRLTTPDRREAGPSRESQRRSRSRTRRGSQDYRSRSRLRTPELRRLQELELQRERVRTLEDELRRERSHRRESLTQRESRSRHRCEEVRHRERDAGHVNSVRERSNLREREPEIQRSREDQRDEHRTPRLKGCGRSDSPTFTSKDLMSIINSFRQSQPLTVPTSSHSNNINHQNILPDFDPSSKGQRIDIWIKKVNECATVYGWDEKTTIHFSMQKLQGLAKLWYESLNSILFSWAEWQQKLLNAFPFEQNYGQSLEDMLKRRSKFNEPLEIYYYEKLALLNRCDIEGKRAVECIIHGLNDKTMRSSANALCCTQPDQLLHFLMTNKETPAPQNFDRSNFKSKNVESFTNNQTNQRQYRSAPYSNRELFCFNCKEKGHPYLKCPKPLNMCTKCRRIGHNVDTCTYKQESDGKGNAPKTMRIMTSESNSKFVKESLINEVPTKAFVDFGSEVSLIQNTTAKSLGLVCDQPPTPLKGFGNTVVSSFGGVKVTVGVDGVNADIICHVVEDKFLDCPLLIGQTFTEQPHILVIKNADNLKFYCVNNDLPFARCEDLDSPDVSISSISTTKIYGPAMVKASASTTIDGHILLSGRIVGKPNHEFALTGGVYQVKLGQLYVHLTPLTESCVIGEGDVLSRGTRIQVVKRICSDPTDLTGHEGSTIDSSKVHVGDGVDGNQKQRLLELLTKYKHCFAESLKDLGCTSLTEMNIEVNSKRPVVYRPYRLSHQERDQVRTMVADMLDAGIVRESVSEYASPIILVRKKDGKQRLCVDYRLLNSVTVKERYPMPVIEDELARLSGQAYFITLDLASGYYQVPIAEESKPLTSFVTPDGQYEFNRMPFGLANAPAVFQRLMNKVLGSSRFTEATAYIDDVLIYGKSVEECLERLENVLKLIERANLTLNLAKCDFLQSQINYLGYEISVAGVRPGDKKIESVVNFPRPTNPHSVRQFLGLVGYFRKFIRNFAALSFPLNKLLKKDVDWSWTDEQEISFMTLKDQLVGRPILAIYDPEAETELHTDASKVGVGGILMQRRNGDDTFRPVAYYSRQTSPEEKNFHAYELETLAVVSSLKKFRVYLLGKSFKVVTDCSALRSTFSKRDLIPRIARWWLLLQEYQCTIEYRAGAKMSHVDALSRNPAVDDSTTDAVSDTYPSVMTISGDDWLQTLQLGDSELSRIRDILSHDMDAEGLKYIRDNYLIKDDKLYRYLDGDKNNIRWVVPKGARWQICRMNHDEIGHFSVEKTLERIKKTYWFAKMSKFVKKYVQACLECAYSKKCSTTEGLLHSINKVEVPFNTLHIDHLGPFVRSKRGNCYLLVIVDSFTKFTFIKPVRNTKSQTTIRVLDDIFYTFRNPDRIISDRGTSFTSYTFKHFCSEKGIRHVLNAVACPRANGQVERYNRTILSSLTAQNLNFDEKDWDDKVGRVQWGINNTCHKATGRTPAEVMFGPQMNSEIRPILNEVVREAQEDENLTTIRENVKDKIDDDQHKQKQRYDKNRRPARIYSEGELVKITRTSFSNDGKSKKLIPSYIGPFRVVSALGNDRYRVAAIPGLNSTKNKRKTTVASDRMMPWVHVAALNVNESGEESDQDDNLSDK
ncbi:unnamed protein product [Plutella xylostella]|uniref:RNA-directed DNA polymerase n=1 Tax=Plutella xylostella TaxID=51655 RepID=A0A8S4F5P0_PLUXY|nr:unnamed protein product [Plutella xylostella]